MFDSLRTLPLLNARSLSTENRILNDGLTAGFTQPESLNLPHGSILFPRSGAQAISRTVAWTYAVTQHAIRRIVRDNLALLRKEPVTEAGRRLRSSSILAPPLPTTSPLERFLQTRLWHFAPRVKALNTFVPPQRRVEVSF